MKNASEGNEALDRYKPPVEGAADKALGIGRDLLGPVGELLMPGASGAISTFTDLVKTPYERRLQQWQEDIGVAVIELSESRQNIVSELKANDEFQSILIQATQAAMRSHQKEKHSALRNAVVNTAKGIDVNADLKQTFVRYVDDLTPSHVTLLQFFKDNIWHLKGTESYENFFRAFKARNAESGIERDEFRLLCEDLKVRVLLRVSASVEDFDDVYDAVVITREGSAGNTPLLRVTEIGNQFLSFISSPVDGAVQSNA
jgi:hypothetical protein